MQPDLPDTLGRGNAPPADQCEYSIAYLQYKVSDKPHQTTCQQDKWTSEKGAVGISQVAERPSLRVFEPPARSTSCRPTSPPVLSKCAMCDTPRLGNASSRAFIPRTKSALTQILGLRPVSVQDIEDLPTLSPWTISCEFYPSSSMFHLVLMMAGPLCRDLRFKVDSDTTAAIRPFLRSVLGPMREKSTDWLERSRHDSPPRCLPRLDSPPLFTRIARGSSIYTGVRQIAEKGASNPMRIPDLASMLQQASPELMSSEDGDINAHHHMQVVDG